MNPSSPKRKRTNDFSPPPPPVVESFSTFFNDPKADILLRSVDGLLFATRRAYLVAASSVFEDMFEIPQPVEDGAGRRKHGQEAPGTLPVVEMSEKGEDLEIFFRWIHRRTFKEIYDFLREQFFENLLQSLLPLLLLARKFEADTVFPLAFRIIDDFTKALPPTVLALAVVFDNRKVARSAFFAWMEDFESMEQDESCEELYAKINVRHDGKRAAGRSWMCSDIAPSLYSLLPLGFFFHLSMAEREMLFALKLDIEKEANKFMFAFDKGFPLIDPVK
ncbi:hypothetical protein BDY24DRAFT_81947 [Mrakia frigida]|uniref:uncharacterized protein n=1 Tax=Mrakia frigida TaxID=29902 RepID=UPI003FCC22B7